ncbi:hypothetical protein FD755_017136 [Muntiacus reevesi]|uniref:Uncharacterized protein n=1 Tax=Muntiacus reevesi TaxID=9886 RepID=A0A5N3XBY9_MUNRE|nr:hypothetical protein FD755_017136 [Muntiacus reevesi]
MPPRHLVLKKETRMSGAFQVMIGLIHGALGRIWIFFYTRQFASLSRHYKPMALLSGYPFWTFLFFIISRVLAIETEKKRSPNLLKYAIRMNMSSFLLAAVGLILIGFEIILFSLKRDMIFWQEEQMCLISWLQSLSTVILEPKKMKFDTVSTFFPSICHEVMELDAMILSSGP